MIFIHGFDDHCNRYSEFLSDLANSGILVHSFDQRGWGRSVARPAEKGLTGPTSQVLADITSFIESRLPSPAPLFLMGHSMGGQEILMYAALGPANVTKHIVGYVAEAPYIRLDDSSQPNGLTVFAGRIVAKLVPNRQMAQKLYPEFMCHDEATCKDWEQDELCHHTGTLEGLAGMLERAAALDKGDIEHNEDIRLFIGHGTGDRVTSHEATKRFFDRSKVQDKTLKSYDGCYHCSMYRGNDTSRYAYTNIRKVHLEPEADRRKFTDDVVEWILTRAKIQSNTTAEAGQTQSKL